MILAEAVRFFSDHGFGGDTRELARRANVSHPLLYKYFSTKVGLIERVYEEVYLGRWNPEWERLIADRSIPLRERMTQFYSEFAKVAVNREWVRIFMFSGLRGSDMNARWFNVIRQRVILPFCEELREAAGLPPLSVVPATLEEYELVQGISTRIFALGIREHIYGMPFPADSDVGMFVRAEIDVFFDGIDATLKRLIRRHAGSRSSRAAPSTGKPKPKAKAIPVKSRARKA